MCQLLLDITFKDYPELDSFLGTSNQELLTLLKDDASQLTFVWGDEGLGKSHLLKAWVLQAVKRQEKGIYVSAKDSYNLKPFDIEQYSYIAIDDVHLFSQSDQIKLFNLFNEVLDSSKVKLLVSSILPPQQLHSLRDDLRTRLGLCLIYEVYPLRDNEKIQTLKKLLTVRQLDVGDEVLHFLLSRSQRDLSSLLSNLQKLIDYAQLHKRRVTLPLLKQFFLESATHE